MDLAIKIKLKYCTGSTLDFGYIISALKKVDLNVPQMKIKLKVLLQEN